MVVECLGFGSGVWDKKKIAIQNPNSLEKSSWLQNYRTCSYSRTLTELSKDEIVFAAGTAVGAGPSRSFRGLLCLANVRSTKKTDSVCA
mmetsp:Transcript_222/g.463  ORF Transcript_222/g.463 Transcript_222/m.463 type:complete len:89 (+) Transcript_222:1056-1322(+)